MNAHRSTAWPLALVMAAVVVYASLYPFVGWRWPPGLAGMDNLLLPWPRERYRADELANFLGYVPLGALLVIAVLRSGGRPWVALLAALGLAALLSYAVELAQQFLPMRVPSMKDCVYNLSGASAGAALALAVHAAGYLAPWHELRERWFLRDSAGAFLLLLLWPVALLFPAPVPLGLGHVWGEVKQAAALAVAGTPWADEVAQWLPPTVEGGPRLARLQEAGIIALGLLAPCLVAYATTRAGWHRLLLVAGAGLVAVGMMTMSTALNFGAQHAWAWWLPHTGPALLVGVAAAFALAGLGPRWAAALGVLVLAFLVSLVVQAPDDPYFTASLAEWERGRLVRFHGIAQWVGWLWPYAAMAWLVVRLVGARDD